MSQAAELVSSLGSQVSAKVFDRPVRGKSLTCRW